tara:strand:+ start:123 stop:299 length:177 start_codon:yes stop_codon:yes gene_type:complete
MVRKDINMAEKKAKKETKKAEPKEEVKKEVKKEPVVVKCTGHSGPPCKDPTCPEWGRW